MHSLPASVSGSHSLLFGENFSYNDNDRQDKTLKTLRFRFFLWAGQGWGSPAYGLFPSLLRPVGQVWQLELREAGSLLWGHM